MKNYDDIFDKLGDSLRPFYNLQKQFEKDIQRRIIHEMHDARTILELEQIKEAEEVWFQEWEVLSIHYLSALKRLKTVNKAYRDLLGYEFLN